jgi:hypothetical protein
MSDEMLLGLIATAIGFGFLALIVILSLLGPRDGGRQLPDNGGAIVPYEDDGDLGDDS